MTSANIPTWWLDLLKSQPSSDLIELRAAVERAGISKNDRVNVERIWHEIVRERRLAAIKDTMP